MSRKWEEVGEDIEDAMMLMSPSGGGNEYDNDPLGLGATVEYVEVPYFQLQMLMRFQFAQHGS